MNPKVLIGVIILGSFIYFFSKSGINRQRGPRQGAELELLQEEDLQKVSQVQTRQYQKKNDRIRKLRNRYKKEQQLGIVTTAFPSSQGLVHIDVELKKRKQWCQLGELDFIAKEMAGARSKKLLLTVEDLSSDKILFSQVVSPKNLGNQVISVKLKEPKKQKAVGLFLCTSHNPKYGCKGNRPATFGKKMTQAYLGKQGQDLSSQDRNYYFQLMMLRKNYLKVPPTLLKDKKYFRSLQSVLPKKSSAKIANYSYRQSKSLGNFPPKVHKGQLEVTLPYNDPRCNISMRGH